MLSTSLLYRRWNPRVVDAIELKASARQPLPGASSPQGDNFRPLISCNLSRVTMSDRKENHIAISVSHSSISIMCNGEPLTPSQSKDLLTALSSMNTIDSIRAALDALEFPAPTQAFPSADSNPSTTSPQRGPLVARLPYAYR